MYTFRYIINIRFKIFKNQIYTKKDDQVYIQQHHNTTTHIYLYWFTSKQYPLFVVLKTIGKKKKEKGEKESERENGTYRLLDYLLIFDVEILIEKNDQIKCLKF